MDLLYVPRWRKTTWAFAVWLAVTGVWFAVSLLTRSDTGAACAKDPDVVSGSQSTGDCADALSAVGGFDPAIVAAIAVLGVMVLTVVRFMTRPLWRQGHGASFRRFPTPLTLAEKRAERERRDRAATTTEAPAR
jgi:hypothetical protein